MTGDLSKYKNTFRIGSSRLSGYDYSQNGMYFVTICTKDRLHHFGNIKNESLQATEIGNIVALYWRNIPEHFPFVLLDSFVIMPNHIHGIITVNKPITVETQDFASLQKKDFASLQKKDFASLQKTYHNRFGPQSKNLASIIRGYKASVKKYAVLHEIDFYWQPRFYDKIIRNEKELHAIREYIYNNPLKWDNDEENI